MLSKLPRQPCMLYRPLASTGIQVSALKVSVRDLAGRTLRTADLGPQMAVSQAEMSLSGLRPGLYLVSASTSTGLSQNTKLVVR